MLPDARFLFSLRGEVCAQRAHTSSPLALFVARAASNNAVVRELLYIGGTYRYRASLCFKQSRQKLIAADSRNSKHFYPARRDCSQRVGGGGGGGDEYRKGPERCIGAREGRVRRRRRARNGMAPGTKGWCGG